ncbi:MAG: aminopeptidase, partial [Pseudomonadota bacterium]|nr:aminopeptidase [Pseudomonadota bacterium]
MFASIFGFELRYQLRNPVFVVTSLVFFLLTFGSVTIDNIQIGAGGNIHVNSPVAIAQTVLIMTVFYMFASTAFVANVVVRDDESGFGPMVRSTSVSKFAYLLGRYAGAYTAAAVGFAAVPVAILIGSQMPWLDQETLGPTVIGDYIRIFLTFALPNILVTSAIFFAVACVFRSMMLSYVGVLVFLVLYFTLTSLAGSQPEIRDTIATIEPFGLGAFSDVTRYWSAAESNSLVPPFEGTLMWNRLIAIALAAVALAIAYSRYSFAEKGVSARKLKKEQKREAKDAAEQPALVDRLPAPNQPAAAWPRLVARTRLETNLIFTSPAFFVLILIGLFNSGGALWFANQVYGTPAVPMTFALLMPLFGSFGIIPIIIAIYFAGELVWRDRDRGMHEIIDSTALPNWAYFIPKVIAVAAVLIATLCIAALTAILVQLFRGYTAIELDKYVVWFILPYSVDMLMTAILAVFFQALSTSKYMGWGLMVIYLVASITLVSLGFEHPLYNFGDVGFVMVSDLNGADVGGAKSWWLRLYWVGVCLILSIIAYLLWRRGVAVSLRAQIARIPSRLVGIPAALLLSGFAISAVTGGWMFYQMNVVNEYVISDEQEERLADYEKQFLQYESVKQPSATHVQLAVDLYPHQGRALVNGRYTLVNDTGAPVEELHVLFQDGYSELTELEIPRGSLTLDEQEDYGYQIYTLEPAMAPDETLEMRFATERVHDGFSTRGADTRLVKNGTFLNNAEFAPQLGFDRSALLQDRSTRRKYDLPAELRMPKLEDESARDRNYVGNVDWVMSDITVTTRADQVP